MVVPFWQVSLDSVYQKSVRHGHASVPDVRLARRRRCRTCAAEWGDGSC